MTTGPKINSAKLEEVLYFGVHVVSPQPANWNHELSHGRICSARLQGKTQATSYIKSQLLT